MEDPNSFEAFTCRCNSMWLLIKNSKTDSEFLDILTTRLLPFLRNDALAKKIVGDWDSQLSHEYDLRHAACRELADSVKEIREAAKNDSRFGRYISFGPFSIDKILEKLRREGCCVDAEEKIFWDYEDSNAYSHLRGIYRTHFPDIELTFAPTAFRFTVEGSFFGANYPSSEMPWSEWKRIVDLAEAWPCATDVAVEDQWWPKVEGDGLDFWLMFTIPGEWLT